MKAGMKSTFWKWTQAAALSVAVCFTLGMSNADQRFNDLGHRMMCTCGCAQLLGECNHVGCTESGRERNELTSAIASGLGDNEILDSFASKYGATVLAAPSTKGFDLVAWIAPFAVFVAALLGTILLVRHWSVGKRQVVAEAPSPQMDALRERIRRETDATNGGF
jgi:cytochrome c-type biogenesis protein CcmH/NrfF